MHGPAGNTWAGLVRLNATEAHIDRPLQRSD